MSGANLILEGGIKVSDQNYSIIFNQDNKPIMEIRPDGTFVYKGEVVEGAPEIYECVAHFFQADYAKYESLTIANALLETRVDLLTAQLNRVCDCMNWPKDPHYYSPPNYCPNCGGKVE